MRGGVESGGTKARAGGGGGGVQAELHEQPSRLLLVAAFAAVYLIWGSTYLGIKYAIETLPPLTMAGARFLIAGALLYGWARWLAPIVAGGQNRSERPLASHWRTAAVVGVLLFLFGNGGVTWAEKRIASSLAALLVATEPLWIVLLGWALPGGSRPSGKTVMGLILGFVGVWLLVGGSTTATAGAHGGGGGGGTDLLGAAAVIAAAFAWAIGSLYSLRAPMPRSPLLSAGMQMISGGALLLVLGLLAGEWARLDAATVSARSLVAFVYLTVFGSIVAFTAYSWLLRNANPARVSTYAYVNPAVAVVLGWALADEAMTLGMLLAAGVIVASVALITTRGKRSKEENCAGTTDDGAEDDPAVEAVHLSQHCT